MSKPVFMRNAHGSYGRSFDDSDLEQVFLKLVKRESEKAGFQRGGDDNTTPITEQSSEFGVPMGGDA
jgi:hypothetical protein